MIDIIYDIETYKNLFTISFVDPNTDKAITYEMSPRKDDWVKFKEFTDRCQSSFVRWVGFNNKFFDYQVIHRLMHYEEFNGLSGEEKANLAHNLGTKIIYMDKDDKFRNTIWDKEFLVPQLDLFLIHHFDNVSRATSLKKLEFNMRSKTIQDLPFNPTQDLTSEQMDIVINYNIHDCRETIKFYHESKDMIAFREELTNEYNKNFMNHNDTKIGKDYLIMELQNAGVECFKMKNGNRVPIQTLRPYIKIDDIIFPYIVFERPELTTVLKWLRKQTITETKGVFTEIDNLGDLEKYANLTKKKGKVKNLNCVIDGFQFDFGTGGIHGSVESTIVCEDDLYAIIDYDVTSLYPSIAIANNIYPEHLTEKFCPIYAGIKQKRMSYKKGTPKNAALKLGLNGVYGDSNNKFSCFYDPQYTMTITINGQLMLCMLAEKLMQHCELIQINTDGVTVRVRRDKIDQIEAINRWWESMTGLELERKDYSKMFIRDVNNYIGLYTDGELKRKGKYEWDLEWHQNHSSLIVQKAVEAHLVYGKNVRDFIMNHDDPFDFMLRTNVPRNSRLQLETSNVIQIIQNVTRYYISNNGGELIKVMPPVKGKDDARRIGINVGFKVTTQNTFTGSLEDVNYDWYIDEAYKLITPLTSGVLKDLLS